MLARELTSSERSELLNLTREDVTMKLLKEFFAVKGNSSSGKPRFNTYDKFTLPQGSIDPAGHGGRRSTRRLRASQRPRADAD